MTKDIHTISLNTDFSYVLDIIQNYRSRAVQAINHASVLTAWHVGAYVSEKIKTAQWGAKVVQQLAEYIHTQDPTLKGWSRRTIYKMVQFYDVYSSEQFNARVNTLKLLPAPCELVPMSLAQMDGAIVPPLATQIEDVQFVRYALNRTMSPTMVAMYEEHLKVGSVLQRSLEEFTDFLTNQK